MTAEQIGLDDLRPTPDDLSHAARVYARRATLDAVERTVEQYTAVHGEMIAEAIDEGNLRLVAVTVRYLAAHRRTSQTRRAELAAAVEVQP